MRFSVRSKLCALLLAALWSCQKQQIQQAAAHLSGGDPERGRGKILYYGCPSCHVIPGVTGANGLVGPPLAGIANRVYIAGVLPNNPDNMVRWIQHPKQVDEKTAMPELNVTNSDARDIAGYLYTLQ
jgi:cytochrome c